MMRVMTYHDPVLLFESVDGLAIKPDGIYVDVTFGGGGHSREILKRLGLQGRLYAFDQDVDALKNTIGDERFVLIPENFEFIRQFLRFEGVRKVDGILADLGVSSHQFNEPERGFSTRYDTVLDMRMDQKSDLTAKKVINEYEEDALANVLFQYGELRNARKLATAIVKARSEQPIKTSVQLKEAVKRFLPRHKEQKMLAQLFQAIRIEVNREMGVLKSFLLQTPELIKPGGRLSVISYHSLEDRLVKRFIREGKFKGEAEKNFYGNVSVPFKRVGKLIVPSAEEIEKNNRARSARLRIAERIYNKHQ